MTSPNLLRNLPRAPYRDRAAGTPSLLLRELSLSEPCGSRYEACLGAVGDVELGEDCRDVVAHRLLAEEERRGDLGVRASPGQELEDLELAGCELGKRLAEVRARRGRREALQPPAIAWAEDRLAVRDGPDRPERLILNRALELVAARARRGWRRRPRRRPRTSSSTRRAMSGFRGCAASPRCR